MYAYQNKITSLTTISHVQFVTGILLIFAIFFFFFLKQLYEIWPWSTKAFAFEQSTHKPPSKDCPEYRKPLTIYYWDPSWADS